MADESFDGLAMAVGVQSAFGTINATIRDLAETLDETDGMILGDKASGDADSGITSPTLEGIFREVAAVAASFTEKADSFQRLNGTGFAITFPMQGNGATATPASGEADLGTLFPGYDALYEMMGLIGAHGTAPVEEYTPRHAGSTGGAGPDGSTVYGTIKVWHGNLSMVLQDCIVESADFVSDPGGNVLVSANIRIGSIDPTLIVDGVTFPTLTYGAMEDNAAPVVEGVAFAAFGQTRDFEALTIRIENTIAEFKRSNIDVTGIGYAQTRRQFLVSGVLYVNASDSDAAVQQLISGSAPTNDLSFQVGEVAGATDTINAMKFEVNNLQPKNVKYDRRGDAMVVTLSNAKATATSAGAEFKLTFN